MPLHLPFVDDDDDDLIVIESCSRSLTLDLYEFWDKTQMYKSLQSWAAILNFWYLRF